MFLASDLHSIRFSFAFVRFVPFFLMKFSPNHTVIKDGSTVRSEFAYYEPRTLNRTVPAYRTFQPGPAPRGVFRGRAPPNDCFAPPQTKIVPTPCEDCAPKKLTGSGELECKSRAKLVFASGIFVIFVD